MDFEQKYLDEYAYLGERTYLNCCSVSMPPQRTIDFMAGFMQEYVDYTGELCYGPYGERRARVCERIGEMIGASGSEIMLTHNTTEGDCLLMHMYPLSPGDSVVVSNFDYPAVILGWYQLQKKGIRVITVEADNGCVTAESLIDAIDETTKIVAVSWVQYMSGYKLDLEKLGVACREQGVVLMVDGIQGLGRNRIDVKKCHIGIFACGGFKGLLGPLGAAFYYCDPELLPILTPITFGEDNLDIDETELPAMNLSDGLPYRKGIDKLSAGSVNNIGLLALGESIGLLNEIGVERIEKHVLELEAYFRTCAKKTALPLHFLGSELSGFQAGTVCAYFEISEADRLTEALKNANVFATVRKVRGQGFLRFASHYYNTKTDIDRLLQVLVDVLKK